MSSSTLSKTPGTGTSKAFEPHILFEDHHLLAINKPAGLVVHAGTGHEAGLVELLRLFLQARAGGKKQKYEVAPIHRLDRDTSGIVLIGKTEAALRKMARVFEHGEVEKHYLVLCKGKAHKKGKIDVPLLTRPSPKAQAALRRELEALAEDGMGVGNVPTGQPLKEEALTLYRRVSFVRGLSLLLVHPKTGRMHQIRRHLKAIGHPLAGDDRWGDVRFNRFLEHRGLKRPFIHAASLSFLHPITGEPVLLRAPLPLELEQVLQRLEFPPLLPPYGSGLGGKVEEVKQAEGVVAGPAAAPAVAPSAVPFEDPALSDDVLDAALAAAAREEKEDFEAEDEDDWGDEEDWEEG